MTVLDAAEIDDPVTRDEQLAMCMLHARAGDRLIQHRRGCPADRDPWAKCYCTPTTLILGALA